MNRNHVPKEQRRIFGVPFTELLAVLAIITFLIAVLYPVFQKVNNLPDGSVQDGSGKPLPNATLRFRDQTGRIVATITSDGYGNFRRDGLDSLSRDAIDGFGLSYFTHRSGSSDLYVFTPLITHLATFRDEAGKPVPDLIVSFGPDRQTWQHNYREPFHSVTNKNGIVQINQRPAGTRFEFQSGDPKYIVERFHADVAGKTIRYAVTVTAPATITGCLRDEEGRPLRGYKAFATISPDLNHFDRWYADYLVTGPTGRFRISNLRPRLYYVSAAPARGYHAVATAQRVSLSSGQTVAVNLRRMGLNGQ
ncbi:MAG: carboxypeptidase-like regulatory domain-containing protein [Armatimonadota bacterium]|nr:carboxypeptidase-like regulatory domain-containing protein [Armatimonadota bacterium]